MIFRQKDSEGLEWAIVYDKAIRDDGSLFFPERLTKEFLNSQRAAQGPYIFANQYQNEIIPDGDQDFKREWISYYEKLPEITHRFCFLDPAISLDDEACFTAFVIVSVDPDMNWYVEQARRVRITATQTVKLLFDINRIYKCICIGIETVAYQEALMHFLDEKMRQDQIFLPLKGIKRTGDKSKEMRIRALVPRFEMGKIYLKPGLKDLEDEYSKFPRGSFVDILDSLSSIEDICFYPPHKKEIKNEPNPNSPEYERWYIQQLIKRKNGDA